MSILLAVELDLLEATLLIVIFMALCQQNGWIKEDGKSLHIKLAVFKWYLEHIWML